MVCFLTHWHILPHRFGSCFRCCFLRFTQILYTLGKAGKQLSCYFYGALETGLWPLTIMLIKANSSWGEIRCNPSLSHTDILNVPNKDITTQTNKITDNVEEHKVINSMHYDDVDYNAFDSKILTLHSRRNIIVFDNSWWTHSRLAQLNKYRGYTATHYALKTGKPGKCIQAEQSQAFTKIPQLRYIEGTWSQFCSPERPNMTNFPRTIFVPLKFKDHNNLSIFHIHQVLHRIIGKCIIFHTSSWHGELCWRYVLYTVFLRTMSWPTSCDVWCLIN